MKPRRMTEADVNNVKTERFLYQRFKLLALNMFKYGGLDDLMIEERHIEDFLFSDGECYWFEDKDLGLMCLRGEGLGTNVMEDPTMYRVTGHNYRKLLKASDCVRMLNNKLRLPTYAIVEYFVDQLYEVKRTRDTNVRTLKLPFMIGATDKDVLTMKKIQDDIDNNVTSIIYNKLTTDPKEAVAVLQTGVKPFTAELTDLYHDILNEGLTYLGINNSNTDKKERLITSEVDSNNQFIDSCAELFLEARKKAVEEINKKFGTHITVDFRVPRNSEKGVEQDALEHDQEYTTRE